MNRSPLSGFWSATTVALWWTAMVSVFLLAQSLRWYTLPALVSLVAAVTGAVALLERVAPHDRGWWPHACDRAADIRHFSVNGLYKVGSLCLSVYATRPWIEPWIDWSALPFWLQTLLALLLLDLILYSYHRLSHRDNFFWRLHLVHHAPRTLYCFNAETKHPLVLLLVGLLAMVVFQLVGVPVNAMVACVFVLHLSELFQHANVRYHMGFLKPLVACGETHRFHHHQEPAKGNVNFAELFTFIDVLAGTYSDRAADAVTSANTGVHGHGQFPFGRYLQQLAYPWRSEFFPPGAGSREGAVPQRPSRVD